MATHSNTLACRIPQTEAPGGLQFMELQRVRHNLATYTHTDTLPSHHPLCLTKHSPPLWMLRTLTWSHYPLLCLTPTSDVLRMSPWTTLQKSRQNVELNLVGFLRNGSQNLIDEINLSKVKT